MTMKKLLTIILCAFAISAFAQSKHTTTPIFKSCDKLLVTGYQAWFRCPLDGGKGKLFRLYDPETCRVDMWPDMREYEKTYDTKFLEKDGKPAQMFSSLDYSTSDLHFKWMKEYGIDAAFVQRFYYHTTRKGADWQDWVKIMGNCMKASQKYKVGMIVMYDLSGMGGKKVADGLIKDWKMLIDELALTSKDTYVFHNGKPLVCIWGIGLNDRLNFVQDTDLLKFLDFLKNDPVYGNCSIMIGTGAGFRKADGDCSKAKPYLHDFLKKYADIVSPWNVGRYNYNKKEGKMMAKKNIFADVVSDDVEWCTKNNISYMPTIYAGFSWHNKMKNNPKFVKSSQLNKVPRLGGKFFWEMGKEAVEGGANMIYISMFDEIDEATAIFKLRKEPPVAEGCPFVGTEGVAEDHYLFLASKISEMLKTGNIVDEMPKRK